MRKLILFMLMYSFIVNVNAWEANVVDILQHGTRVAVTLNPDPGIGKCEYGSPYILIVDESPAAQQRFSIILSALISGKKVRGYADECSTAIWGKSRPTLRRLGLTNRD